MKVTSERARWEGVAIMHSVYRKTELGMLMIYLVINDKNHLKNNADLGIGG